MGRYRIQESVGTKLQAVHSYEDLEIHHPSKQGREPGRVYSTIDGEREEVLRQRTGSNNRMVSKDFILSDLVTGSSRVPVPAPVSGYVGKVDPRNGLIAIYDREGGELLAQVRHMDLRDTTIREGQQVHYGQPLGLQGGFGGGNPRAYGTHVHIDFNERYLGTFKQYFHDIDAGTITIGESRVKDPGRSPSPADPNPAEPARGVSMRFGDRNEEVRHLQKALGRLGYRDMAGAPLRVDGDFGSNTEHAVRAFQAAHGLNVDGVVGSDTRRALVRAEHTPLISERTHQGHELFRQALAGIRQLPGNRVNGGLEEVQAAAALAVSAKAVGMNQIDRVLINTRGDALLAIRGDLHDPARQHASVDREQAESQPLGLSRHQWEDVISDQREAHVRSQTQLMEHRNGLVVGIRP